MYDDEAAYKKTQVKSFAIRMQGNNGKNFAEQAAKAKSFVPGAGTYKDVEKAYSKLS